MTRRYLGLWIVLCLCTLAPAARAQGTQPKARALAEQHFKAGEKLQTEGKDRDALLEYRQAYALYPTANTLFNIALAEQHTGDLLKARDDLLACLKDEKFRHVDLAKKHLDELHAQLGHVRIQAPAGTAITIDGQEVLDWTGAVDVLPGSHTLTATNGWQVTRSVDAPAGKEVEVRLEPPPSAPTPAPPATPSVAPPAPIEQPAPPGDAAAASPSSTRTIVVASLGGLALASAAVGVVFGLQAVGKSNDLHSLNGQRGGAPCPGAGATLCQSIQSDYDAEKSDGTVAGALYIGGGLLAAGAIATWLLWPRKSAPTAAWIVPTVGRDSAGLSVSGGF